MLWEGIYILFGRTVYIFIGGGIYMRVLGGVYILSDVVLYIMFQVLVCGCGVRMYHRVCVGGVYVLFQVELELLGGGSNVKV